ncbi:MAG: phosphatidylserine decarboxylase [Anaerolineales bacterium]
MNVDPRVEGWSFEKPREGSILATFILFSLAVIILLVYPGLITGVFTVITFSLWAVVLYFFRDPERTIPGDPNIFYSPGDGVVSDITTFREEDYLDIEFVRVGIFLSIFDVHVQRAPIEGEVDFITHQMGKNLPAFYRAASQKNDQIIMGLNTCFGKILVKQISGILARKCFNYARVGDTIKSGQRYGLIKFGSRVELYLPENARLLCDIGDKVKAGITGIAEMAES